MFKITLFDNYYESCAPKQIFPDETGVSSRPIISVILKIVMNLGFCIIGNFIPNPADTVNYFGLCVLYYHPAWSEMLGADPDFFY